MQIAQDIVGRISLPKDSVIEKIDAKGGYVNFFFNYERISKLLLKGILGQDKKYGSSDLGKKQKVLIEYSAPNPNKPMHIGHARNNFIGMSIHNILSFASFEAHPVNWINDRGSHICKSLWGYLQFGKRGSKEIEHWKKLLDEWYNNEKKWLTPKDVNKKPDYFVMDFYVKANNMMEENEEYDKQNREILQEWENENPKVRKLWKKMNAWAYEGWNNTYKRQGCIFEKYYYESDIYKRGKGIVSENIDNRIFVKTEKDTVIADLEKHGLPGLVFIRSDGTSLYSTADLALTEKKVKDYPKAKYIWVVGVAQKLYFEQLFTIFELLGYAKKESCYHLGYGMVSLPEGKMSSRKGTVILSDDLMDEVHNLIEIEVEKRNPELAKKKKDEITEKIALGAIKYDMLKIDAFKDMVFDPKEVIKFEGNTGPYLQYAYVRANNILKKAKKWKEQYSSEKISEEEKKLINKLLEFPSIVEKTAKELKPHYLCNYGHELSDLFNTFYHFHPVLQIQDKNLRNFRLTLVKAFTIALKNCLTLLGIDTPDVM